MFPIPWNRAFRKKDGTIVDIADAMSGGGGGGSYTPDYDHDILVIGIHEGYNYYIPMEKAPSINASGYEIKTNPGSTSFTAKVDIYSMEVVEGIPTLTFIKTLVHNDDKTYDDDNITVTYTGSKWQAILKVPMKDLATGNSVTSPTEWNYDVNVDYKWYIPEDESNPGE